MQPSVIRGQSAHAYHSGEGVNKSLLDVVRKSPAHAQHYLNNRETVKEHTPAQLLGSAFHSLLLEPMKFAEEFAITPTCDKRSTAGKIEWTEFLMENAGKTHISPETHQTILEMCRAVLDHEQARTLLAAQGEAETSVYWRDPETDLLCRCRPDFWRSDNLIVDVKTTADASPEGFARSVADYRYHVQAAFYMDGIEHCTGKRPEGFVFLAIEKKPPYAIGLYILDPSSLIMGENEYRQDLNKLFECKTTGEWETYGQGQLQTLSLPAWYFKQMVA